MSPKFPFDSLTGSPWSLVRRQVETNLWCTAQRISARPVKGRLPSWAHVLLRPYPLALMDARSILYVASKCGIQADDQLCYSLPPAHYNPTCNAGKPSATFKTTGQMNFSLMSTGMCIRKEHRRRRSPTEVGSLLLVTVDKTGKRIKSSRNRDGKCH